MPVRALLRGAWPSPPFELGFPGPFQMDAAAEQVSYGCSELHKVRHGNIRQEIWHICAGGIGKNGKP